MQTSRRTHKTGTSSSVSPSSGTGSRGPVPGGSAVQVAAESRSGGGSGGGQRYLCRGTKDKTDRELGEKEVLSVEVVETLVS